MVVTLFFIHDNMSVPWKNAKRMNFRFSNIYREGNRCADNLANYGIRGVGFIWWEGILPSISYDNC